MSCGITDLTGCVGDVVSSAVTSVWDQICQSFGKAAASMLQAFGDAFAQSDKVTLTGGGVSTVYGICLGLAGFIGALLLLGQIIRTVWSHDGRALAQGLTGIGKAAIAFMIVLGVSTVALEASDDITSVIVSKTYGSEQALGQKIAGIYGLNAVTDPTLLLVVAVIGILLTVVLWFELLFRAAAITILVATSPLSAVGQMSEATKPWWTKWCSSAVQLIMLKPLIALVFCLGISLTAQSGGIQSTITGLVVLLLAVFSWPAIARFFTFASVSVGGAAGLGAALGFASGRLAGADSASGVSGAGGEDAATFSQGAESRTSAAKSALGLGSGSDASAIGQAAGLGSAAGGAAKRGALQAAMGKAGLAATGPVGAAVLTAKAVQGAVNAVGSRMEQAAGHAGLSHASPYHRAAGDIPGGRPQSVAQREQEHAERQAAEPQLEKSSERSSDRLAAPEHLEPRAEATAPDELHGAQVPVAPADGPEPALPSETREPDAAPEPPASDDGAMNDQERER